MSIIGLPTDPLNKFFFIGGLALLVYSFTAPMKFADDIVLQTVDARLKVAQLDIELKNQEVNSGSSADLKLQNEIKKAHSKIYHEELTWLDCRRNHYHTLGFLGAFSGLVFLFMGLMMWIKDESKKRIALNEKSKPI
jgi:hypothetical protein